MKLILASNSPRRKEILEKFGFKFTVKKSDYEEKGNAAPETLVKTFATGKAESIFNSLSETQKRDCAVLGADTVVVLGGEILGKPKDRADAENMLKALSGRTHFVYTGYAVISAKSAVSGVVKTEVKFNDLSEKLIKDYVATGSPLDKAGAYGIQDGFPLVRYYKGSLYNVIGLPIEELEPILKNLN